MKFDRSHVALDAAMGCTNSTEGHNAPRQRDPLRQRDPNEPLQREDDEASVGSDFEEVDHPSSTNGAPVPAAAASALELMPPNSQPIKRSYRASTQLLGKGGSAVVYAGVCMDDLTPVAIKRVHIKDSKVREALEREYKTLASLPSNPRVVTVHHFECLGDQGIIVLELVKGGTLRRLMRTAREGRLHERSIRLYIRDCLLGLEHLHAHGVIHRDVKGDNILVSAKVDPDDSRYPAVVDAAMKGKAFVKLTDFGSCKEVLHGGVCETTVNVVGTVPYMSPEAVRGKFSTASDVWALGITMIELASGREVWPQFGKCDAFQLLLRIGRLQPPNHMPTIPQHLSDAAKEIIVSCLQFDASRRPSCGQLLSRPYFSDLRWSPSGLESVSGFEVACAT